MAAQRVHNQCPLNGFHGRRQRWFCGLGLRALQAHVYAQRHAFCHIAQLAHIAGPVMGHQRLQPLGRELWHRPLVAGRCLQGKVLEQQRNVFPAFAQRRQVHGDDVEAVVKIGTKQALLTEGQQINFGSSNHTAVHGNQGV